jgi:hypothetical protein
MRKSSVCSLLCRNYARRKPAKGSPGMRDFKKRGIWTWWCEIRLSRRLSRDWQSWNMSSSRTISTSFPSVPLSSEKAIYYGMLCANTTWQSRRKFAMREINDMTLYKKKEIKKEKRKLSVVKYIEFQTLLLWKFFSRAARVSSLPKISRSRLTI